MSGTVTSKSLTVVINDASPNVTSDVRSALEDDDGDGDGDETSPIPAERTTGGMGAQSATPCALLRYLVA